MGKRLWLLTAAMLLALCLFGCKAKIDDPARYLSENAQKYGYSNALSELTELSDTQLEDAGFLRLQQNYQGIPVYGRTVVYVTDERGDALTMTGNVLDVDETLDLTPSLSPADAMALLASQRESAVPEIGEDDLCIYNLGSDGASHLAYQVNLGGYEILLDAHSGQVLAENPFWFFNSTVTMDLEGDNETHEDVILTESNGGYQLYDPTRNITAYHMTNQSEEEWEACRTDGEIPDDAGYEILEWHPANPLYLFADSYTKRVTADAYVHTQITYDFFDIVLHNPSPDGHGTTTIEVYSEVELLYYDNAYKDLTGNAMSVTSPSANTIQLYFGEDTSGETNQSRFLDVVAHEYMHSVEQMHSHMCYTGEAGAIMEGLSDIFGELVEGWHYKREPDWKNGNDTISRVISTPSTSQNPGMYQGVFWLDLGTVSNSKFAHTNSTVISHAAYLMSESGGGLLTLEELANLWYRAMLMMPSTCTFTECRERVEWAALTMSELSDEKRVCISEAFDRVNIPSSRIVLAPQGKLTVLDRLWMPYDNYSISIWYYDVADPEDNLLAPNDIALKLLKTEEVTSAEPYIMDLRPGFYVVELTDGADSRKTVDFELFISSTGPAEKEMDTNFGACPLRVEVYSLGTVAEGATVTAEIDGEQFSAVTDEFGACTFILPETAREIHLTAHKDGLGSDTAHMTLTENDLLKRIITAEPMILPPPYAEIVTQYEQTWGSAAWRSFGGGYYYGTGVFYLDLLDFDGDGIDELAMGYGKGSASYSDQIIEIWTMENGAPKMVHRDVAMHASDISRWFCLREMDGKWYVGSGWVGYEVNVTYYGLANGKMYQTVSFGYDIDENTGKTNYMANGHEISSTEYKGYYSLWQDSCEVLSCLCVSGEWSAMQASTDSTRAALGLDPIS